MEGWGLYLSVGGDGLFVFLNDVLGTQAVLCPSDLGAGVGADAVGREGACAQERGEYGEFKRDRMSTGLLHHEDTTHLKKYILMSHSCKVTVRAEQSREIQYPPVEIHCPLLVL